MRNEFVKAASPDHFISPRLRGGYNEAVYNTQSWLLLSGEDPGPVDGLYGSKTAQAINNYLAAAGVDGSGTLSLSQYNELGQVALQTLNNHLDAMDGADPESVLIGDTTNANGAHVVGAEIMLEALGVDVGNVDGVYDATLRAAIVEYQQSHNMEQTGVLTLEQYTGLVGEYAQAVDAHMEAAAAHAEMIGQRASLPDNYNRFVFYGDSIAVGLSMHARAVAEGPPVVNLAIEGAGIYNHAARLGNNVMQIQEGDLVVISIGSNDMANLYMPRVSLELPNSYDNADPDTVLLGAGNAPADLARNTQAMLTAAGVDVGGIDGAFGPNTMNGIRVYQEQNGYEVTGSLTVEQYRGLAENYGSYENLLAERLAPYQDALIDRIGKISAQGGYPVLIGLDAENYANWSAEQHEFNNNELNAALAEVAARTGIPFIDRGDITLRNDPNSDGLHGAYGTIYEAVMMELTELAHQPEQTPRDLQQDQITLEANIP